MHEQQYNCQLFLADIINRQYQLFQYWCDENLKYALMNKMGYPSFSEHGTAIPSPLYTCCGCHAMSCENPHAIPIKSQTQYGYIEATAMNSTKACCITNII